MAIAALDPSDERSLDARVAGPAALLAVPSAVIETARMSPGCRSSRAAVRPTRMTPERSFSP
jgi:hypothetical protein